MASDVVLRLKAISKRFGELRANDAISLELKRGEILALLGENGAGKSTLISILYGEYVADSGTIEVNGVLLPPGEPRAAIAAGIGNVHQHFTLAEQLSVLDNIMLGTEPLWRPWRRRRRARAKLMGLSKRFGLAVDPEARIERLSVGERQRVEILKALYRDAQILILDEPTAVLTPQETEALFGTLQQMARAGLSLIFISHKLNEVLRVSDRVLVLRAGRIIAERAPGTTRREELAELMVGARVPAPVRQPAQPGTILLELRGVSVLEHGRTVLDRVDLTVCASEIVAIAGVAGNGQHYLAELVGGLRDPSQGERVLFGHAKPKLSPAEAVALGIGRIPEDRQRLGVVGELPLWQNAILERLPGFTRRGGLRRSSAQRHTQGLIERFAIRCQGPRQRTALLSGGNMQKLIVGRVFAAAPRLLVANQPTRGLDVSATAFVQQQLLNARTQGAGILLLSEDLDEVLQLADCIAVIYRGRLTAARPTQDITLAQLSRALADAA